MAKTLRSRIAAVAVAAVGVAVLQAAPAFAAASATPFRVSNAESVNDDDPEAITATQIAGANNYVSLGFAADSGYNDEFAEGELSGFLNITGGTFTTIGKKNVTINAAGTSALITAEDAETNVNVLTPTAGKITVEFVVREWDAGVASEDVMQTITITVGAATKNVYGSSKAYISHTTGAAATADSTAAQLTFAKSAAKRARITVTQYDKQATPVLLESGGKSVTVTLTGVGALGTTDNATGSYMTSTAVTSNFYVYSDGRAGTASIAITVNGVAVATKTVSFYGSVASLTVTQVKNSIADTGDDDGTACDTSSAGVVATIKAKDAAGIAVPVAAADFTAITSTVKTAQGLEDVAFCDGDGDPVAATAAVVIDPTATKTGSKTLTITHDATGVTATVTFVVALAKATTVTITTDKTTYAPGQAIKYTVTAKDAGGNAIPDGTVTDAVSSKTNMYQNADLPANLTFKSGVATFTLYASATTGDFTYTGTVGSNLGVTALVDTDITSTVKVAADTTAVDAVKADVAKLTTTITTIQTAISTLVASTTATLTVLGAQIAKIMKKLGIK